MCCNYFWRDTWLCQFGDYGSRHTQLCQLANYPSFIVRLSFVIRSFGVGGDFDVGEIWLGGGGMGVGDKYFLVIRKSLVTFAV